MARPKRAASASTTIITLRVTSAEARRLNELVKELGHKDRSALLRSLLAQPGHIPRNTDDAASAPAQSKTKKAPANAQRPAGEIESAHSNRNKQSAQSNTRMVDDLIEKLEILINREKDPRTGLSPMPNVMRALLPHFTRPQIGTIMSILCATGRLELYAVGRERLSCEDEALCPTDSEGTLCTSVRWIGKE